MIIFEDPAFSAHSAAWPWVNRRATFGATVLWTWLRRLPALSLRTSFQPIVGTPDLKSTFAMLHHETGAPLPPSHAWWEEAGYRTTGKRIHCSYPAASTLVVWPCDTSGFPARLDR